MVYKVWGSVSLKSPCWKSSTHICIFDPLQTRAEEKPVKLCVTHTLPRLCTTPITVLELAS